MDTVWPRKGDSLFRTGGYRNLNVSIVADLSLAAVGYKDAADLLVESLNERGRNDALVFPIAFCYRQYLELQLKALAVAVREFSGEDVLPIHDLHRLWQPLKSRLANELAENEQQPLEAVDECISEFARIDPKSTTFRYPEFAQLANHSQIGLGNLRAVMNRVATFLESVESCWDVAV